MREGLLAARLTNDLQSRTFEELCAMYEQLVYAGVAMQSTDSPEGVPLAAELDNKTMLVAEELDRRGYKRVYPCSYNFEWELKS
jgi:hypothetical protein